MTKDPLTHALIGHAMKTHRALGPGLGEEFYHQDFVSRLLQAGIEHLSKPRRDLIYRGMSPTPSRPTSLRWLHLPWGIAFHFGRDQTDLRIVSQPLSKAIIPQIQGQPQIGIQKESFSLGSAAPIVDLQDSFWLPE